EVVFVMDRRKGREHVQTYRLLAKPPAPGQPVNWKKAESIGEELVEPAASARWAGVPESLDTGRKLKALEKGFAEFLYGNEKLSLFQNRALDLLSEPNEPREQFQQRCRAEARRKAAEALELEKLKFAPKFEALDVALPEDQPSEKGGSWLDWINPFKSG